MPNSNLKTSTWVLPCLGNEAEVVVVERCLTNQRQLTLQAPTLEFLNLCKVLPPSQRPLVSWIYPTGTKYNHWFLWLKHWYIPYFLKTFLPLWEIPCLIWNHWTAGLHFFGCRIFNFSKAGYNKEHIGGFSGTWSCIFVRIYLVVMLHRHSKDFKDYVCHVLCCFVVLFFIPCFLFYFVMVSLSGLGCFSSCHCLFSRLCDCTD